MYVCMYVRTYVCTYVRSEDIADFFSLPKKFLKESETGLLEAWFAAGDTDGDGQMTWEELKDFYIRSEGGWQIDEDAIKAAIDAKKSAPASKTTPRFVFNAAKEDRLRRIFSTMRRTRSLAFCVASARSVCTQEQCSRMLAISSM